MTDAPKKLLVGLASVWWLLPVPTSAEELVKPEQRTLIPQHQASDSHTHFSNREVFRHQIVVPHRLELNGQGIGPLQSRVLSNSKLSPAQLKRFRARNSARRYTRNVQTFIEKGIPFIDWAHK